MARAEAQVTKKQERDVEKRGQGREGVQKREEKLVSHLKLPQMSDPFFTRSRPVGRRTHPTRLQSP